MNLGFDLVEDPSGSKHAINEDAPTSASMRESARGGVRQRPSTDEKKVKNRMRRQAGEEGQEGDEPALEDVEASILAAMAVRGRPWGELQALAAELEDIRSTRRTAALTAADIDLADAVIHDHLTPVLTHVAHTAATDWIGVTAECDEEDEDCWDLDDIDHPAHNDDDKDDKKKSSLDNTIATEASLWFGRVSAAVKADREEFAEQAQGMARRVAGSFAGGNPAAQRAFLDRVAFLHRQATSKTAGYDLECYGCGKKGDNETFGLGNNRQCPDCGSYEIHSPDAGSNWGKKGKTAESADACPKCGSTNLTTRSTKDSYFRVCGECGTELPERRPKTAEIGPDGVKTWDIEDVHGRDPLMVDPAQSLADENQAGWGESGLPEEPDAHMEPMNAEDWDDGASHAVPSTRAPNVTGKTAAGSNGYVCMWRGKRIEVHADTTYEAQQIAQKEFGAKKGYEISVMLAEKGGEQVTHDPSVLGSVTAAEGGSTCANCGASIERDPAGEEPRTWHHNDGSSHDHEATPGGGSGSKESSFRVVAKYPLHVYDKGDDDPTTTEYDSIEEANKAAEEAKRRGHDYRAGTPRRGSKVAADNGAIGETRTLTLPFSEVCMHMQVAGKTMEGRLVSQNMVQLVKDGRDFSFPITTGEAGWGMTGSDHTKTDFRDGVWYPKAGSKTAGYEVSIAGRGQWTPAGGDYEQARQKAVELVKGDPISRSSPSGIVVIRNTETGEANVHEVIPGVWMIDNGMSYERFYGPGAHLGADKQNGNATSGLPLEPEGDDVDEPMWPWEIGDKKKSHLGSWVADLDKDIFSGGIDNVTKGMLRSVLNGLSPANAEKFSNMSLEQAVTLGWRLVSGGAPRAPSSFAALEAEALYHEGETVETPKGQGQVTEAALDMGMYVVSVGGSESVFTEDELSPAGNMAIASKTADFPPLAKDVCQRCGSALTEEQKAGSTHGLCSRCFELQEQKKGSKSDEFRSRVQANLARMGEVTSV